MYIHTTYSRAPVSAHELVVISRAFYFINLTTLLNLNHLVIALPQGCDGVGGVVMCRQPSIDMSLLVLLPPLLWSLY